MNLPRYTASQWGPRIISQAVWLQSALHNAPFPTFYGRKALYWAAVADYTFQRQHNLLSSMFFLQDDVDTPSMERWSLYSLLFETGQASVIGSTNRIQQK